jgi:hypothetical protein
MPAQGAQQRVRAAARGTATQCVQPRGTRRRDACNCEGDGDTVRAVAGSMATSTRFVQRVTQRRGECGCREMTGRSLRERATRCVPLARQSLKTALMTIGLFGMDDIMCSGMRLLPGPPSRGCYLLLRIFGGQSEAGIGIRSSKAVDWHYYYVTCVKFGLERSFEGTFFLNILIRRFKLKYALNFFCRLWLSSTVVYKLS